MLIYLNGTFCIHGEAGLDPLDRGVLLGEGVFETIRVERGQVLFARAHFQRLAQGARLLEIPWRMGHEELLALCQQVVDGNELSSARLRITLTSGDSGGVPALTTSQTAPTLLVVAMPLDPDELAEDRIEGWSAISTGSPVNHHSILARVKSTSYVEHLLARREAVRAGAKEAVRLNTDGLVAECAMANLFAVLEGDRIVTPPTEDGALAGVMRRRVLELCAATGVEAVEAHLTLEELGGAREVFATNVMIEVMPIVRLNGVAIGTGEPGPITTRLFEAHRQALERDLAALRTG